MTNLQFMLLITVLLLIGYIIPVLMFWLTPPALKLRAAASWPIWVSQQIFKL